MPSLALVHGALGDTVLLLPALEALARAAPPLEVWGPSRERLSFLLAPLGPAASVSAFPPHALPLWSDAPLSGELREWLRARRVVSFGVGPRVETIVATPRAGEPLAVHALEAIAERFLGATGLVAQGPPRLAVDDALRGRGRAIAGRDRFTVCHPGSGSREKRWPLPRFLELLGDPVVVTGPVGEEWPIAGDAALRVISPSLMDLAALLAAAGAYAGNDSGPTHLAAALGTPTLAVFGPTDPAIWRPRGVGPIGVVRGDLDRLAACEVRTDWDALGLRGEN